MSLFKTDIFLEHENEWLTVLRVLEDMGYVDTDEPEDRKRIRVTHRGAMRYFETNTGCRGSYYEGESYRSLVLEIDYEGRSV